NQAAHGDREAAHLHARLRLRRKIVVGHWSDPGVLAELGGWARAARGWQDWQGARFARFGDNMRQVAVTDGDKVEAEATLGFSVDGYGVGDLAAEVAAASPGSISELCAVYEKRYRVAAELKRGGARHGALREAARIEAGLRSFLEKGRFKGFTTTFEDLHGLRQLPGIAVQRLMAEGYGFGAEGDWKTCALLRAAKVMGEGEGPASFMEDYTYHLGPGGPLVLGAHMLEVCESIASDRPAARIHPLGIGGKDDPVRLVFDARPGTAVNLSLVDLGDRFRLIAAEVDVVPPPKPMPKLPVARAIWKCRPDFKTACSAWLRAGGAHHTALSYGLTAALARDFAEMAGIELLSIGRDTRLADFENELRWNEAACSRR
ncbi:MAG: L-arabinose isomerase family protein, partial [Opitutaceae bacterium]